MIYVLAFLANGILVVLAGTALARHADAIAEATKLGQLWFGSHGVAMWLLYRHSAGGP
ncbi:MAG: hypothetical protein L6R28_04160 [Planctomycetes bacterium]|nr:hypothetical protein [Planctomycetota bacterium]